MPAPMMLDDDAGSMVRHAKQLSAQVLFLETVVEHFGDRSGKTRRSTNNEADVRSALAPFRAVCATAGLYGNRVEFQRMLRDAEAGAFEAIVLFDIDRFGRHAHHTMVALHKLADLGVSAWDYSTGVMVDLESMEGRISATLKAEFAQQYRDQVRKHTRAAHRRKAEQGFVTGGRAFGYDNHRVTKGETIRVINEPEAAVVREIYSRFAAGDGARTIAATASRRVAGYAPR